MQNINKKICLLVFAFLLSGCSNSISMKGNSFSPFTSIKDCPPDAIIDWVDVLMIEDIEYLQHFPNRVNENLPIKIEKGREIGKVTYKMADSACSDHKMRNGDAALLREGTSIYEIKRYPTALMVTANDDVYIANTNNKAKTAGEFYPLDKFVKNIYFQSTEDGKRIHTFSQSSKDKFLSAFSNLPLNDVQSLIDEGKLDGTRIFLEIELDNGISFRLLYWADFNTFHMGAIGNDKIKKVINDEVSLLSN